MGRPQSTAHLAHADDDSGARHEAGDDRVGDEVGDEAQVEDADQRVHDARQECNLRSMTAIRAAADAYLAVTCMATLGRRWHIARVFGRYQKRHWQLSSKLVIREPTFASIV